MSLAGTVAAFLAFALLHAGVRLGALVAFVVSVVLWSLAIGWAHGPIAAVTALTTAASLIVVLVPLTRRRWRR
jgi:hypothetical protein